MHLVPNYMLKFTWDQLGQHSEMLLQRSTPISWGLLLSILSPLADICILFFLFVPNREAPRSAWLRSAGLGRGQHAGITS